MTFDGKSTTKRNSGEPDYVVGQYWYLYGTLAYLIDETRGQWSFTETKHHVQAFHERCTTLHPFAPTRHIVEKKANGAAILSELRSSIPGMVPFNPDPYGDKTQRAWAIQPRIEAGQVFLPADADWLDQWKHELRVFPNGRNDDRVDALTQALLVMGARRSWRAA